MASQKSPWVDPTVSTLGETMAGALFQVWWMARYHMLRPPTPRPRLHLEVVGSFQTLIFELHTGGP